MYKRSTIAVIAFLGGTLLLLQCSGNKDSKKADDPPGTGQAAAFGGYESQAAWGHHLVAIGGCNDCHTPKIMTPQGPDLDTTRLLSGHPSEMPPPDVNRKELEAKGIAATNTETAWVGPWGISYAANLTPDSTGLGSWKADQFIYAIRHGTYMGLPGSRPLLPPMPWPTYRFMTDEELKAIFAYLQSLSPIHNVVPPAMPPVGK